MVTCLSLTLMRWPESGNQDQPALAVVGSKGDAARVFDFLGRLRPRLGLGVGTVPSSMEKLRSSSRS